MFPKLEKCCCGSLQFGTKFIAWLQMIYCFIMLLLGSVFGYIILQPNIVYNNQHQFTKGECMNIAHEDLLGKLLYIFLVFVLGINFIFVITLLFGIYKEKYKLLIPHIFSSGLRIICLCLLTFFVFLYSFIYLAYLSLVPVLLFVNSPEDGPIAAENI